MNLLKKLTIRAKLFTSHLLILSIMTVISLVVYLSINSLNQSTKLLNQTYDVILKANNVAAAMLGMETGQRGFMITGSDDYLEPFNLGQETFDELIEEGSALTSNAPLQVERWEKISELGHQWISEAALPEIIARRQVGNSAEALANFKEISSRTVGKEIFDGIRKNLTIMNKKAQDHPGAQHLITQITLDLVNMETGQRGFLLTGNEESLEPYIAGERAFKQHLKALNGFTSVTAIKTSDIQKLGQEVKKWREKAADLEIAARREMNKYEVTMNDITAVMQEGKGKLLMDQIRGLVNELIAEEVRLMEIRGANQKTISSFAVQVSLLGTVIAFVVGLGIAYLIIRSITKPIKDARDVLSDLADGEGDLTMRVPVISEDEVGQMSDNVNAFIEKLSRIIQQILALTHQISSATTQMNSTTQETTEAIKEQDFKTTQIATAVEEMSNTTHEVAANAEQASHAAKAADEEANKGNVIVRNTIQRIHNLVAGVGDATGIINTVKTDSENIGAVLDVIKGVAEQTNLLALNAAIEAARAGEHGRGFAVVADEVRTLAQRAQESTVEIENLIESLQGASENAVAAMESSQQQVLKAADDASHAGESLESITESVTTISQMNIQIATAAEEQSATSKEISKNVVGIQQLSSKNAVAADEIAKASCQLESLSEELDTLMRQFKT